MPQRSISNVDLSLDAPGLRVRLSARGQVVGCEQLGNRRRVDHVALRLRVGDRPGPKRFRDDDPSRMVLSNSTIGLVFFVAHTLARRRIQQPIDPFEQF